MSYPPTNLTKAQMETLIHQQGDEVRRLSSTLKKAEASNADLLEEIRTLKIAQVDLTSRLNGARALINEHKLNTDDYRPCRLLRTPTYKKDEITPFYVGGRIPAAYVRKAVTARSAQKKDSRSKSIVRLGAETMWDDKFNTCTVVRPNKLRNGQAPMTRLTLKRVGYDDKFQAALLKLHARNKMVSLEEDVEDFEEEDDNS